MGILSKSRRRFLGLGAVTLGALALVGKLLPQRRTPKRETVKLLTHDGKLVEVDAGKLPVRRKLVRKQELVSWVWKDQQL